MSPTNTRLEASALRRQLEHLGLAVAPDGHIDPGSEANVRGSKDAVEQAAGVDRALGPEEAGRLQRRGFLSFLGPKIHPRATFAALRLARGFERLRVELGEGAIAQGRSLRTTTKEAQSLSDGELLSMASPEARQALVERMRGLEQACRARLQAGPEDAAIRGLLEVIQGLLAPGAEG